MSALHKRGTPAYLTFPLLDDAGDLVTGAVQGDFTTALLLDDATDATAVAITERATGIYQAEFTPASDGEWYLAVRHTASKVLFDGAWTVRAGPLLGDAIDGYTPEQILALAGAVLLGKASGGPAGTVFRAMDDSADRVATTADEDGDRSAVALTP